MANTNPYTPSAGHPPKYLAGRHKETGEFLKLLDQNPVMENLVITGLRGIGKTVLLNSLKPQAIQRGWFWVGEDCSEQVSVSEETLAIRILTDLALFTSNIYVKVPSSPVGFTAQTSIEENRYLDYNYLYNHYNNAPGLVGDKLKNVLQMVADVLKNFSDFNGLIFAYDEAQNFSDQAQERQYPLSLLLDVFQSLQRNQVPFMLILTGLPTLTTKLVEARTYSERLFKVLHLSRLSEDDSREAILRPLASQSDVPGFSPTQVQDIINTSGGYPYFIQFICKEVYDIFLQQIKGGKALSIPMDAILQKLDTNFFIGRWLKATDRERELLFVIAESGLLEFGLEEVSDITAKKLPKKISSSQIFRHFKKLINDGLIYKTRRGNYSFAVPLMERFILRNTP